MTKEQKDELLLMNEVALLMCEYELAIAIYDIIQIATSRCARENAI
ncbi:hypothetical protein NUACC26_085990 [Scytonema sp. NUACC26]